jgi:single-strand DNA-binding protein
MNKVILQGRLTKDPELRYTSTNNIAVCTFTLAVNRKFAKEGQTQADFIPIVVWDKLGEVCGKHLSKGRKIDIVGRIETRTWDDNEGKKHYVTEVIAEEMYFADDKKNDGSQGQQQTPPPPPAQNQYNTSSSTAGGQSDTRPPWMR